MSEDQKTAPIESLFEAPPMAEQERMLEAILFATRRTDFQTTARGPLAPRL